jgi:hypothetical protein
VLNISSSAVKDFEKDCSAEINKITSNSASFLEILSATRHIDVNDQGVLYGLSHRLAKYVVD